MAIFFGRDMVPKAGHIDCLCGGGKGSGVKMFEASESVETFASSLTVDKKFISQPETN